MKNMKNKKGFTLIEIMIVVAIIIILAVIAVPAFEQARLKSQAAACVNNLRQISAAYDLYYLETGSENLVLSNFEPDYIKKEPDCPTDGTYTVAATATCDVGGLHVLP